ncbi:MAG: hypothetical protein H9533_21955 [Rhodobacteraceae bacterium]|nr:hypothetical protein [Paracoccaceae bacterium]
MPTFLLAVLANTLLTMAGWPYTLGLLCLASIPLVSLSAIAFTTKAPDRMALEQLGRTLAWLAAPAIAPSPPYLFFTNPNALLTLIATGMPSPAALCGIALGALCLISAAYLAILHLKEVRATRKQSDPRTSVAAARRRGLSMSFSAFGGTPPEQSGESVSLEARMLALTEAIRALTEQIEALRRDVATPDQPSPDPESHRAASKPRIQDTFTEPAESPQDAAIEALNDMGYYQGPWTDVIKNTTASNPTEEDGSQQPDTYPPISDDPSFLDVLERRL